MNIDFTKLASDTLNIPIARHPCDGGDHKTWLLNTRGDIDEALNELKQVKVKSILQLEQIKVLDSTPPHDQITMWKFRGLLYG